MNSNVVLICGSRNWKNSDAINQQLKNIIENYPPSNTIIIHGDCQGADKLGAKLASNFGYNIRAYPAEWNKYGKGAGPIRNEKMLKDNNVNLTLAFCDSLSESRGTLDMIKKCLRRKIPVRLFFIIKLLNLLMREI